MATFNREQFTITEEHLTLLRNAYVGWEDCEFGAPAIDCKRPYGNSDVVWDMAELLGIEVDEDEGPDEALAERLTALHRETQTVLQIAIRTGKFEAGMYERTDRYSADWTKVSE